MWKHSTSEWKAICRESRSCFNYYLWSGMIKNGFIIAGLATFACVKLENCFFFGVSMNWSQVPKKMFYVRQHNLYVGIKLLLASPYNRFVKITLSWRSGEESTLEFVREGGFGERPRKCFARFFWRWPELTFSFNGRRRLFHDHAIA